MCFNINMIINLTCHPSFCHLSFHLRPLHPRELQNRLLVKIERSLPASSACLLAAFFIKAKVISLTNSSAFSALWASILNCQHCIYLLVGDRYSYLNVVGHLDHSLVILLTVFGDIASLKNIKIVSSEPTYMDRISLEEIKSFNLEVGKFSNVNHVFILSKIILSHS